MPSSPTHTVTRAIMPIAAWVMFGKSHDEECVALEIQVLRFFDIDFVAAFSAAGLVPD